ncbi:hypothetical protein APHNP_1706 [Anaplasma phagocytophilum str. ApNP]|uniref:Uncharacterized protein n=2 Tax=Anaplasma phagocytophilum TaxID=948 RepID=A0A0F3NGM0_ANAPH|nr:hypothetical protein APHMUC_0137 [Anaplasma phagocytophilum str. ApMUC09]KJV66852.1 hypothetical protein APHNP_1706 [Anaplasma phagocytophilum str. ApNP]SCV62421.1 hypothetical protein ANAPH2_00301 [Anaplasma phagocytophilum]
MLLSESGRPADRYDVSRICFGYKMDRWTLTFYWCDMTNAI